MARSTGRGRRKQSGSAGWEWLSSSDRAEFGHCRPAHLRGFDVARQPNSANRVADASREHTDGKGHRTSDAIGLAAKLESVDGRSLVIGV
jgi:hypothetical protein